MSLKPKISPGELRRIPLKNGLHDGLIGSLALEIMGQLWKIRDTHDLVIVLLGEIKWMG